MYTGENEQGLRKILDLTRWLSLALLFIHFYYYCYGFFEQLNLRSAITDRLLQNVYMTGLFTSLHKSKLFALVLLIISLFGARGKKDESVKFKTIAGYLVAGVLLYFLSFLVLSRDNDSITIAALYMGLTLVGFFLVLTAGTLLSRIIHLRLQSNVFNTLNETFPQEERLLTNEYSINLSARYNLRGRRRKSWINIISPFRGLLIMGTPGSGKSYFIIQNIIMQHIEKGFSMFVYDFKFDDLTRITYNHFLRYGHKYSVQPKFYLINFDDLNRSHRCNPLHPFTLNDITDAAESSRTIMLGLNHEWIKKSGDFFVESPINFVTALIWFLRKYKNGKYCTLPHVIELAQVDYDKLFTILRAEPEIDVLINPFVMAYTNDAMEQLEGQIASAKISLGKLSSARLYYVLTGNDFTLDINNPDEPKIVCMGNNPQKMQTYGAVLSLYITAMARVMNKKDCNKSSLIFDEFPTIYLHGIDQLLATARSNKVATTLAVQDASQLRLHYGKEQAEVIVNIAGNIISGQVSGETAKQLSERFGRIFQDRQSISINRNDTSITKSRQLETAIPVSTISSLSSGEFVGMVADDPDQKIQLKGFCAEIVDNNENFERGTATIAELPALSRVGEIEVHNSYIQVRKDIEKIVQMELERIMDTPELAGKLPYRT